MARPNPRYGDKVKDEWITQDGYTRNLFLEEFLPAEIIRVRNVITSTFQQKGSMHPMTDPNPSWWTDYTTFQDNNYTLEEAIEYLKVARDWQSVVQAWDAYRGEFYPRDPSYAQRAAGGYDLSASIKKLESQLTPSAPLGIASPFEIIPQASAEEEPQQVTIQPSMIQPPTLSSEVMQIINDISNHKITAPAWFVNNNVNWVISGHITEQEFLIAFNNLVHQGIIILPSTPTPTPTPIINDLITDNMVTQKIDYFTIENGRAIGQITFTATQNFNPFYYNKTITNIIEFKDRNGANILSTVKQNNLRFTETERDETIQYDEGMNDNIYSKVSSFVWSSATAPTAFSKILEFEIRENEPPKPIASGFMAAGVAGAIAGLVLLGFIVDSKVGK